MKVKMLSQRDKQKNNGYAIEESKLKSSRLRDSFDIM